MDHLPRRAAVADHHPGAQRDHRDAAGAQQALHLLAAAQVGRQVVVRVAQAAEVDDAAHSGAGRSGAEAGGGGGVAPGEVPPVERVREVVGDVDAGQGAGQRVRVVEIGRHGLAGARIAVRTTGHGDDVVPGRDEPRHEAAADEARGPDDEDAHAQPSRPMARVMLRAVSSPRRSNSPSSSGPATLARPWKRICAR